MRSISGASERTSSHRPINAESASTNAARGCGSSDAISRHTAASNNSTLVNGRAPLLISFIGLGHRLHQKEAGIAARRLTESRSLRTAPAQPDAVHSAFGLHRPRARSSVPRSVVPPPRFPAPHFLHSIVFRVSVRQSVQVPHIENRPFARLIFFGADALSFAVPPPPLPGSANENLWRISASAEARKKIWLYSRRCRCRCYGAVK